jgi:hypothetical protein
MFYTSLILNIYCQFYIPACFLLLSLIINRYLGNSSDEDDSILSDTKPDYKPEVQEKQPIKQKPGSLSEVKASVNAWGPAVIHEESNETDEQLSWQQPIRAESNYLDENPSLWKHNGSPVSHEYSAEKVDPQAYIETKAIDSTRYSNIFLHCSEIYTYSKLNDDRNNCRSLFFM